MTRIDPHIPAHEHGVLRLFTLDTSQSAGRTLHDNLENGGPPADRAAAVALGVGHVDAEWITLLALRDVADIGLASYLIRGFEVPPAQVEQVAGELAAATGHVLIVPSRAFGGAAATLAPAQSLVPLVGLRQDDAPATAHPMSPATGPAAEEPDPAPVVEGSGPRPVVIFAAVLLAAVVIGLLINL
jgi:hypothetical protein